MMHATDSHALKQANACVVCGLCLPHCPTYQATGLEAQSPRGRIQLMRGVLVGDLQPSERIAQHLSDCLTCRACERACPNQVEYGSLVDTFRQKLQMQALISPKAKPPSMLRWVVAKPWRLKWMHRLLKTTQLSGVLRLSSLQKSLQNKNLLDDSLGLPALRWAFDLKPYYPTQKAHIGDVALFTGCIARSTDWHTLKDSITLLNALGYHVHVPKHQGCCGAIAAHAGDDAHPFKQTNQQAFENYAAMPLLYTATGCGTQIVDSQQHPQAEEICAFLARQPLNKLAFIPLHKRVLVQIPCSHYNTLKNHDAIRVCLQAIPELKIQTLGHAACCGAAGSYHLQTAQYPLAKQLQADKIAAIKQQPSDYLATTNIGCALWLRGGLKQHGSNLDIVHPVSLLAQQLT